MLDEETLMRRARAAYFRSGKNEAWRGGQVMQPSKDSGVVNVDGKTMVRFLNVNGTLAVYGVLPSGRIKRIPPESWPDEMRSR